MKTNTERIKARMEGAKAALESKKMDANTYDETDDLHFEWLSAWTAVRMDRLKSRGPNAKLTHGGETKGDL